MRVLWWMLVGFHHWAPSVHWHIGGSLRGGLSAASAVFRGAPGVPVSTRTARCCGSSHLTAVVSVCLGVWSRGSPGVAVGPGACGLSFLCGVWGWGHGIHWFLHGGGVAGAGGDDAAREGGIVLGLSCTASVIIIIVIIIFITLFSVTTYFIFLSFNLLPLVMVVFLFSFGVF